MTAFIYYFVAGILMLFGIGGIAGRIIGKGELTDGQYVFCCILALCFFGSGFAMIMI